MDRDKLLVNLLLNSEAIDQGLKSPKSTIVEITVQTQVQTISCKTIYQKQLCCKIINELIFTKKSPITINYFKNQFRFHPYKTPLKWQQGQGVFEFRKGAWRVLSSLKAVCAFFTS